jgi:hypothetical protein
MSAPLEECAGWLNGTLDTWSDPSETRRHASQPGGFTSMAKQDKVLYELIFSKIQGRRGTYVDVAANHYKRISNTYFYDTCLQWRGLCVEPNQIYWEGLASHRSCELVRTCASDRAVELDLMLPPVQWLGGMGGVVPKEKEHPILKWYFRRNRTTGRLDKTKPSGNDVWKLYPPSAWNSTTRRMKCVRVGDELARLGFEHVDFMSLDVEGHEAAVLRGIDFSRFRIDHILCENNCNGILEPLGYTPINLGSGEDERLWSRPGLAPLVPPCRKNMKARSASGPCRQVYKQQ